MNVLCEADSDGDKGLFGLREMGDISEEEAVAAFSSDEEEEEERTPDVGGVHMLAAAGDLRPGPAYVWGRLGTRKEYVKIMIDSGNTVGDLVSEEFAERLGLVSDDISDHIAVPTSAAATTLLVVKKCRGVTARLAGIAGEFTIQPLVARGLTHPVNLGQHFLGRYWCSLDFATGCTQLGVWGQSVKLVGRLATRPPWAKKGMQPRKGEELPLPAGSLLQWESPPPAAGLEALRRGGELCPLEAMLMGTGEQ